MHELNLVPYSITEKNIKQRKQNNYIAGAIAIVLLLFLGAYIPRLNLKQLEVEEAALKGQVDQGKSNLNARDQLKKQIDDIKQYNSRVDLLSKQRVLTYEAIKNIDKYLPADISLRTLSYSKSGIILSGATQNYNSITEFGAKLQASEQYKKSAISNISYDSQKLVYTFSLNISIQGVTVDEKSK